MYIFHYTFISLFSRHFNFWQVNNNCQVLLFGSDVVEGSLLTPQTAGCCRGEAAAESSAELTRVTEAGVPPRPVSLCSLLCLASHTHHPSIASSPRPHLPSVIMFGLSFVKQSLLLYPQSGIIVYLRHDSKPFKSLVPILMVNMFCFFLLTVVT